MELLLDEEDDEDELDDEEEEDVEDEDVDGVDGAGLDDEPPAGAALGGLTVLLEEERLSVR